MDRGHVQGTTISILPRAGATANQRGSEVAFFFSKLQVLGGFFQHSSKWYWRRWWHPTPVLLPGKLHGQRRLVGCSPWGREESDPTERLHFHFSLSCIGGGNGNPLQCSCLENPRDGGAWWAAVSRVAQSRTWLKQLSSNSSSICISEVIDISSGNLGSNLCFIQPGIPHDVLCIEVKDATWMLLQSALFPHLFATKWWDQMLWSSFECWALSQLFHAPLSLSSRGSSVPLHFLP